MENRSYNSKKILILIAGFVSVVFVFILMASIGINSTKKLYGEMIDERKQAEVLKNNIDTLKKIDSTLTKSTDKIFLILPDKNLTPIMLSNFKTLADGVLTIDGIKSEQEGEDGNIKSAAVVYEGEARDLSEVLSLLEQVQKYSPLTMLELLDVKSDSEQVGFELKLTTFWSDLPTELPKTDLPVTDLSDEEKITLNDLSAFKGPTFIKLDPQPSVDRPNPFK